MGGAPGSPSRPSRGLNPPRPPFVRGGYSGRPAAGNPPLTKGGQGVLSRRRNANVKRSRLPGPLLVAIRRAPLDRPASPRARAVQLGGRRGRHRGPGPGGVRINRRAHPKPGRSASPRPVVGSPGPPALKAADRPPPGRSRVGSGDPGPTGPRPSGRPRATAAGPDERSGWDGSVPGDLAGRGRHGDRRGAGGGGGARAAGGNGSLSARRVPRMEVGRPAICRLFADDGEVERTSRSGVNSP
jgi:hypothetical protein